MHLTGYNLTMQKDNKLYTMRLTGYILTSQLKR